jgi:mycothiol system anti-sigma-R factor
MITCSEAVRQLWEYLDGSIDEPARHLVEEHLAFCRRCCGELEFAEELAGFLARPVSDDLPPEVRARLMSTLDQLEDA